MPSLDTNCLLRWLLNDVPEHTQRVAAAIAGASQLAVSDVALIEAGFVLERAMRFTRAEVAAAFGALATEKKFTFDREFWRAVTDLYVDHPKLSLADIYLALDADRRAAAPLLTLDAKLARQLPSAAPV